MRSYSTDRLPTPQEALGEPFRAFLSWNATGVGKVQILNEMHAPWRDRRLA